MRIAIFRALYLGDILCSIPAIRHLKKVYPASIIYYIGLPQLREFVMRFSYIDYYISFPGYPGLPEQEPNMEEIERFILNCREERFDLLIQLQGDGTVVNEFLPTLHAQRLVGFCPVPELSNGNWMHYPKYIHEIYRHLGLLRHIGMHYPSGSEHLEYPLFQDDYLEYGKMKDIYNLSEYVVFHVGAKSEDRRWPIERFVQAARYLEKYNFRIVCTGVANEYNLVKEFVSQIGNAVNLAGLTDYGTLGCIIKDAKLLICNCTGVSHIASALETKSIVISLDGEPERWRPLNNTLHITFNGLSPIQDQDIHHAIDILL